MAARFEEEELIAFPLERVARTAYEMRLVDTNRLQEEPARARMVCRDSDCCSAGNPESRLASRSGWFRHDKIWEFYILRHLVTESLEVIESLSGKEPFANVLIELAGAPRRPDGAKARGEDPGRSATHSESRARHVLRAEALGEERPAATRGMTHASRRALCAPAPWSNSGDLPALAGRQSEFDRCGSSTRGFAARSGRAVGWWYGVAADTASSWPPGTGSPPSSPRSPGLASDRAGRGCRGRSHRLRPSAWRDGRGGVGWRDNLGSGTRGRGLQAHGVRIAGCCGCGARHSAVRRSGHQRRGLCRHRSKACGRSPPRWQCGARFRSVPRLRSRARRPRHGPRFRGGPGQAPGYRPARTPARPSTPAHRRGAPCATDLG